MIHRMVWTDDEERQVFEEALKRPGIKWNKLWPACQQILPDHRRKQFNNSSVLSFLTKKYRYWLKRNQKVPGETPAPTPDVRNSEQQPPHIIVIERVVKQEPDYGAVPTSLLARILLERLAIMDQFDQRFREMEAMIQAKNLAEVKRDLRLGPLPPPPEPPKEHKVRIAIVGPLDSQAAEIEGRCASAPARLKFYDKDQQRQDPDGIFDYAIVTDHCNHAWWNKMKAVLPADKVFFVNSGVQSVTQKVWDLCSRKAVV